MPETEPTTSKRALLPARPSKVSRFLRKHNRLIAFVGAMLVFTTFIVREGFREDLRDFVDSLEAAQGIFVLQRENGVISGRLAEVYRWVSATYANVLSPPPGGVPQLNLSNLELHYQDASDSSLRVEDELSAAGNLLKKAPHSKEEEQTLAKLQTRYDAVSKKFREYVLPGSAVPQSELMKPFNEIVLIEREVWDIESNLTRFTALLLKESLEAKEKYERYFRLATWLSYGLYSFGWALALVGKLYGPKAVDGGDGE
jgi:hypothetical protein